MSAGDTPSGRLRRFLEELLRVHDAGQLRFFGEHAALTDAKAFKAWLTPLRKCESVVCAKRPFTGPQAVLAYLSRYTRRVAIDWHAGTITLRHTKGRRVDILPLPVATVGAIARYLELERPKTTNRAIFVRNVAPRDAPIGADLIRITIRQAYARAGLPYTRSHLLRHTMANRLLASGSSL